MICTLCIHWWPTLQMLWMILWLREPRAIWRSSDFSSGHRYLIRQPLCPQKGLKWRGKCLRISWSQAKSRNLCCSESEIGLLCLIRNNAGLVLMFDVLLIVIHVSYDLLLVSGNCHLCCLLGGLSSCHFFLCHKVRQHCLHPITHPQAKCHTPISAAPRRTHLHSVVQCIPLSLWSLSLKRSHAVLPIATYFLT